MFAKLNHLAIVSDNYAGLGIFYRAVFGLKSKDHARFEASALSLSDGYLGMNINPRMAGRQAGIDHFGIQVEDVETVRERVAKRYPNIGIIQRPSNRPFAGIGIHDPAGNYFDLSQKGMANRAEIYESGQWEQPSRFKHFALKVVEPERLAEFYSYVFDLPVRNSAAPGSFELTDGRMTMLLIPWKIEHYLGTGIERPAIDHIGFAVEDLPAFKTALEEIVTTNPVMRPKPLGVGAEGGARKRLFESYEVGDFLLADPDGVMLAVSAASQ